MENYFSKQMPLKSDAELQLIIDNKGSFQEDAYIAAIDELEKRNLASEELSAEKGKMIERKFREQQVTGKAKSKKGAGLEETIKLLKPTKDYLFTPIIVYLNILIYLLMTANGVHPVEPSVQALIDWGGNLREVTLDGQPWRLLTSVFLHGGLFHLLLNMYALFHIGGLLESKFGKGRYLFAYIATGLLASIASITFNFNIVSVGASGAIFGMYGLFLSLLILKVIDIPKESRNNLTSSILFFIGYNLFYGFTQEGIDNAAHIGGLISGFILGFVYLPGLKQPKYSKFITSGLSVVLVASILIMPKLLDSKWSEFQATMNKFSTLEERALWMYNEDLSFIPEDKKFNIITTG